MYEARLKAVYQELTQSEKRIADYISAHMDELKTATSQELANRTKIGQSTIIRFSQKLGYNSFRELLADLSAVKITSSDNDEIQISDTSDETNRKIIAQYQDITQLTYDNNSSEIITQACKQIVKAKQVIAFGIGSSNLFCEYLSNQLVKLGMLCVTSQAPHTIYSLIDNAQKGTLLFLLSESGETSEVLKAAQLAKEKGIYIIAMTHMSKNSLHHYADLILKSVNFETGTYLNVTTMRCSQLLLLDMIYLNILRSDFKHLKKVVQRSMELSDH